LEIIKEKRRDDTDEDKSFIVSGTVVQKAEWRTEIHSEGGIPKCYQEHNILSIPLSWQQSTQLSILL
jgi:hypothetical protein